MLNFILLGFLNLLNLAIDKDSSALLYSKTIKSAELKKHIYELASDKYEGRETGEAGQWLAADYISKYYKSIGIAALGDTSYFQKYLLEKSSLKKHRKVINTSTYGANVLAFIKGKSKPDEIIILSAHYDHLGKGSKGIYYGADDDGSGTSAIMEMAHAFKEAELQGKQPARSILIINFSGEEKGLLGSEFYTEHPVFPFEKTVVDLNIDMVGRADGKHTTDSNFVYLIGSDKLSNELHLVSEEVNKKYCKLKLDYTYNNPEDPNRYYYRSDHYNFAKNNVPVIFYFSGVHEDYHRVTDTPDKINYSMLEKRTRLFFLTAWEIADRPEKLKLN